MLPISLEEASHEGFEFPYSDVPGRLCSEGVSEPADELEASLGDSEAVVDEGGWSSAGLWGCGKRGPSPVSHSPHRLDDDETILVSIKPGEVQSMMADRWRVRRDRSHSGRSAAVGGGVAVGLANGDGFQDDPLG